LDTAAALWFADLKGPQIAPLPRKRLSSSAAGGRFAASPPLRHCGLRTFQVRKSCRCLENGALLPPKAALRRFSTVAALQFADLSGPQIVPLSRKRLVSSAAGGASPLSPHRLLKKAELYFARGLI